MEGSTGAITMNYTPQNETRTRTVSLTGRPYFWGF